MKTIRYLISIIAALAFCAFAAAQAAQSTASTAGTGTEKDANAAAGAGVSSITDDLGLAVGIGSERFKKANVETATINGTTKLVTIDESRKQATSAWLTTNWTYPSRDRYVRPGIFFGVKLLGNDGNTFDALALGGQLSFIKNLKERKSINIGAGWVTHTVKTLASGIVEGQPLPAQYDQIKYQKRSEGSWMIMVSANFF